MKGKSQLVQPNKEYLHPNIFSQVFLLYKNLTDITKTIMIFFACCTHHRGRITLYTYWSLCFYRHRTWKLKSFSHDQKKTYIPWDKFYERRLCILSSHEWLLLQAFTWHKVKNQHSILRLHTLLSVIMHYVYQKLPHTNLCRQKRG